MATGFSGPMTYLQYRVYLIWLSREERRMTRTHFHLMQVGAEVRRASDYVKDRTAVRLSDFDLPADEVEEAPGDGPAVLGNSGSDSQGSTSASSQPSARTSARSSRSAPSSKKMTDEEREREAAISRARWGGILGAAQRGAKSTR